MSVLLTSICEHVKSRTGESSGILAWRAGAEKDVEGVHHAAARLGDAAFPEIFSKSEDKLGEPPIAE